MNTIYKNTRNVSLDLLRCLAAIMVITMHVVGDSLYASNPRSTNFVILIFYNAFCRSAVPIFFMLSGAFSNSTDIKSAVKKALKYVIIFFFISLFYGIIDIIYSQNFTSLSDIISRKFIKKVIEEVFYFKYHLWYLPAYIFTLLLVPIVNICYLHSESFIKYMSVLFVIYIIIQTANLFVPTDTLGYKIINIFPFWGSYIGYFVWGKFLIKTDFSFKQRIIIYILGLASILSLILSTYSISIRTASANEQYYKLFTLYIFLSATFYFIFFKNRNLKQPLANIVKRLTPHTFNIYLFHVLIVDFLTKCLEFRACSIFPLLGVPFKVFLVFIISIMISILIRFIKNLFLYITSNVSA